MCGYTWREIDAMTLPQVNELLDYWRAHPPLHLMLAAALDLHDKGGPQEDFAALMALAPAGVLRGSGKP